AERLTEIEREPATQQYLLLIGALRSLAEHRHAPSLVLDSYLLRALAIAGWAPSFDSCARCDADGPHRAFSAAYGGMVCPRCRPPGAAAPAPETVTLLGALLTGDWRTADASEDRHRKESSGLVAVYTQWHLERALRSPPPHPSGARPPALPPHLVPKHVAVVMDGNGRWANARGLPRTEGHAAGEAVLLDVVAGAIELGITHISAYAFSTENWKRSPAEV